MRERVDEQQKKTEAADIGRSRSADCAAGKTERGLSIDPPSTAQGWEREYPSPESASQGKIGPGIAGALDSLSRTYPTPFRTHYKQDEFLVT